MVLQLLGRKFCRCILYLVGVLCWLSPLFPYLPSGLVVLFSFESGELKSPLFKKFLFLPLILSVFALYNVIACCSVRKCL